MSTILDTIMAHKRREVDQRKKERSIKELEHSEFFRRNVHSMVSALHDEGKTGIIAEFKRKSPSKGIFNAEVNVNTITSGYAQQGASGLSILTDTEFFGGSTEDLLEGRRTNPFMPILRKDFVVDEYQILEAKAIGADVILLIAECLNRAEILELAGVAGNLGMEVLLEMHTRRQLDKVVDAVSLVGVNNRDLETFQVNLNRSMELAVEIGESLPKVAESGIGNPATMMLLRQAGFDGFLIGEQFMKHSDPVQAFHEFVYEYQLMDGLSGSLSVDHH